MVKAWKLCPQKHAKLLQMPWASLTARNRWMANGHTLHLDALFISAAHKAAVYILELAMGTTMENSQPYAMLHGHPQRRQLMMSWRVQIVVKAWKLCPQKHAKLEQMPGASLTTMNR